ncbi:MAG TPA: SDR family NAD(P)-dependent oxidoreductase [Chitinophagaceae bacterium]|nr:SDR family NAD(P)-dependent oxidoreductase [Chitinophagaceae bacterium]
MILKNSKVLVTGADGFIGSHLVEQLLDEGASVRALVFYNAFNSWGWLDSLPKSRKEAIEVVSGDIRDPSCVAQAMKGMDLVFHLAALIGIPFSYQAPESYLDTNVRGTLHVLQAARQLGTSRVLLTSTSEVYGTARYVPMDEEHPRQPQSPYSATKIAADCLAESFWRSFDLPLTIVRPFNTYGPRQSARAIIPTIITQLIAGQDEILLGALHPTRDLVFVTDTVAAFLAIAKSDKTCAMDLNIATGTEISMESIAATLIGIIRPQARVVLDPDRLRPGKSEVERLLGSAEKLRDLTGWKPDHNLAAGLKATVEWFREPAHLAHYKPDIFNL